MAEESSTQGTHSTPAVIAALTVDGLITLGKLGAFVMTGSVAILAEVVHSLADVINQVLLVVGIVRSRRAPDAEHPYGFGRSRYVWALLSAAGVLFVGSGMALLQGIQQVLAPTELHDLSWGFVALGASAVAEGVSLCFGLVAVHRAARQDEVSFLHYLRHGDDPVAVAVVLEDGVAVLGVGLALASLGLAATTGDPAWDGAGSIAIGLLLGGSAGFLIDRNRHLLLDVAPPPAEVARMVAVLEQSPVIEEISDVKATRLGPDSLRFKAEITFDGGALARRLLEGEDLEETWQALGSSDDLEALLIAFGDRVVRAIGDEVDRVEQELGSAVPEAHHVDLEPD